MMRYYITGLFFLCSSLFLPGCKAGHPAISGQSQKQEKKKKSSEKLIGTGDQKTIPLSNTGFLIEAKKEAILGNLKNAYELYRRYVARYPQDPVGMFELGRLEASQKNFLEATRLLKQANLLDPSNIWYQLFLAELYQVNSDYTSAIGVYEKIVELNPENLDYHYQLAALYLMIPKFPEAIRIYDKIEESAGISEEITIQKEKIYLQMKDLPKAEGELKKLIQAFPDETRYYSILAEFYMANNNFEKAIEIYRYISEKDPENPYIHMSMADYFRKIGKKEKAFEELKLGFANPRLDVDTKVNILLSFYTVNELFGEFKEQAFILTKILIDTHPNDAKCYSMYGDLLAQDKKFEEARNSFIKSVSLDSSKYILWEEVMRLDLQLSEFQHLVSFGQKAIELFPEQPIPYLFAGLAQLQLKSYEEALRLLNTGVKLVVNNDELQAQFYMYLGDTYHSLKNSDESDKAYEMSLKIKGDNAYVLNNYAYYLSLRGESLDKAEKMAQKAVTIDPENSSFQDTYGWVFYRLGNYAEAKLWIGKAMGDKDGPSADVLEHYGDVLFKLGDKTQAVEYWIKAKAKGEGSPFLDKKITDRKLYE